MIYIKLDSLPPSANQAYFNLPSRRSKKAGKGGGMVPGGRALTKAGKAYKETVVNHIVKHHGMQTQELKKDACISCFVAYGIPDMYNSGWPDEAKSRYKKIDLANFPKLLQDAICEATSMDDRQICFDYKYKYQSEKPETSIYIWNEDETPIGRQLLGVFASIIGGPRTV